MWDDITKIHYGLESMLMLAQVTQSINPPLQYMSSYITGKVGEFGLY